MTQPPTPPQRVSAVSFPPSYALPQQEKSAPPQAQDAFRQTQFLLADELRLFEEGMNLQLRIVQDAAPSSFRTHPYAALMAFWSRTFLLLTDACLLVTRGSYSSVPALARAACELVAAQHQLHATEMELYLEWLAGGFAPNEEHKAIEFGLGHYFAGETLAADERLRAVYRPASELGRPNFGATLLATGPESNNRRIALDFAAQIFHFGWAELEMGWLLALCERQLAVAVHAKGTFPIHEDIHREYTNFAQRIKKTLAKADRCSIDEFAVGAHERLLV